MTVAGARNGVNANTKRARQAARYYCKISAAEERQDAAVRIFQSGFSVRLLETSFLKYPIHKYSLEKFSGSLRTY